MHRSQSTICTTQCKTRPQAPLDSQKPGPALKKMLRLANLSGPRSRRQKWASRSSRNCRRWKGLEQPWLHNRSRQRWLSAACRVTSSDRLDEMLKVNTRTPLCQLRTQSLTLLHRASLTNATGNTKTRQKSTKRTSTASSPATKTIGAACTHTRSSWANTSGKMMLFTRTSREFER